MLDELNALVWRNEPLDVCATPERARRATLSRAAAEGRRLLNHWGGLLSHGELEYEPVTAYALARPAGNLSLGDVLSAPASVLAEVYANPDRIAQLAEALRGLDLRPLILGATSVSFETTVGRLHNLFGIQPEIGIHPVIVSPLDVVWQPYLHFASPIVDLPGRLREYALLVDMDKPVTLAQPPPAVNYLHVGLVDPLRAAVNCQGMAGNEGQGVEAAIIDTGLALDHPYFGPYPASQLSVTLMPDASFNRRDPWGHGTAMTAAVLALAPRADVAVIKMPITKQRPALRSHATDAVILAMSGVPAPRVVLCAWGIDENDPHPLPARLRTEIAVLGARHDALFVCAAGNRAHLHPANMDEVLAVGGAYRDGSGNLVASDYASSFTSRDYPGRECPDVAGPCGPDPLGIYVMAPTDEVSYYDVLYYGRGLSYPDGDMTHPGDGWCGMGGSSMGAAVAAGVAAVVRGAHPGLSAAETKDILMAKAEDIPAGRSADGHPTRAAAAGQPGPWAGGMGMVNAHAALLEALVRKIHI
jgi:subtilisin family serine protease